MIGATGCRNSCNCGVVEAALRDREMQLAEIRDELDRSTIYNQSLIHELRTLQGDYPAGAPGPVAAFPVKTLALGRQTGGRSTDDCGGDDALQVIVEPRDPEDQAIKAPGSLVVQALEINNEGLKTPLSSWAVSPEQLRRSWRNSLLTTGYVLTLPWKTWPNTNKLKVVAQLRLLDGRLFEAEREVTVRVTPTSKRKQLPPPSDPSPGSAPVPDADNKSLPVMPAPETAPEPRPTQDGPNLSSPADDRPASFPLLPPPTLSRSEKRAASSKPAPPARLGARRVRPASKPVEPAPPGESTTIPSSAWHGVPPQPAECGSTLLAPSGPSR